MGPQTGKGSKNQQCGQNGGNYTHNLLNTLNDFKNAPLFKIVCGRMNKFINYTYVTDQLFKLCSHNLLADSSGFCTQRIS